VGGPILTLVHDSPGRLRLRAAGLRGDDASFEALARRLLELEGVREVRVSARTTSVLILYAGARDALLARLRASDVARVELREQERAGASEVKRAPRASGAGQVHAPMLRLKLALGGLDRRIARETEGALSLGGVAFSALIVAGVMQAKRRHFWPAGLTLISYAFQALDAEARRESARARGAS
jgi:hypothetical protein